MLKLIFHSVFKGNGILRIIFMKSKLFLIITALASIAYAADNAVPFEKPLLILEAPLFKAEDGTEFPIRVAIGADLILQSEMLKEMEQCGFMGLHNQRDEVGNPVLSFKELTANQLSMLPSLLKFEQQNTIELPECPNLYHYRKAHQKRIDEIIELFTQKYPDDSQYAKIFEMAEFFGIPLVKQVMGQLMLSPELDLKMLEENKYPYYIPSVQNSIAIQLRGRMALAKEQYFAEGDTRDPYFKGVSVQDYIDHGRELRIKDKKLKLEGHRLNSLEGLQTILDRYKRIRNINLKNNMFKVVPDNIFGGKITELNLSENRIKALPHEFIGWNNLDFLDLSSNEIEIIPSDIKGLEKLTWLYLDKNKIRSVPDNIKGLEQLRMLLLMKNKIKTIPNNISGLEKLMLLELAENKIEDIPDTIKGLKALGVLGLAGNPVVQYAATKNLNKSVKAKIERLRQSLSDPSKGREVRVNYMG